MISIVDKFIESYNGNPGRTFKRTVINFGNHVQIIYLEEVDLVT